MTRDEKLDLIKDIIDTEDLAVALHLCGAGFVWADAETVLAYVENVDDFRGHYQAEGLGCHYDLWKLWRAHVNDQGGRCQALTRKGVQCENGTQVRAYTPPDIWVPGISDRCSIHREVATEGQIDR